MHKENGKVFLFVPNAVLVSDINAFKLLNSYQLKKSLLYKAFDINNPTIFSTREKEYHSKRKRLLSPAFSAKQVGLMESLILEMGTLNLVEHLDSQLNGEIINIRVNIYELFYRSTLDVISHLVFGESLHCIENPEEFKHYMKIISNIQKMFSLYPLFPILKRLERPTKPFERIVEENMRKRRENKSSHSDILQSMMDTQDEDSGIKLRDDEIIDEAMTLLVAGFDTTSNSLIFTIYEVLKNPTIYNKLVAEILKEFPNPDAKITVEDCRKRLPLLEATILESFRFRPVAFGPITRIVPAGGVTIDGHFIPEGTLIALNSYAINYSEEHFPHASEFNIDKWLSPERETYKSKLYTFSSGPRSCIGRELAWMEMFLVLSHLLHRFELELVPDAKLTPVSRFLLSPKENSLYVNLKKRVF
ncbi:cytochrome P450 [Conidiobolus coronatus NRRL 28638]|uniref:Cytochrome P450 n=1 Tax=Conidiobolus coronatus (strain ATCC 28846 / CBS 209.66 / NRRL 28638) TaxID=796925 RepID=A0A137NQK8_CONC2|nr:cytochrome P450 [Conidiobolus coronatus NRRL 28638]|eukprot:KXN65031.1 cytochrome P450 [Conidiobolus coronatus NRRL 28638]